MVPTKSKCGVYCDELTESFVQHLACDIAFLLLPLFLSSIREPSSTSTSGYILASTLLACFVSTGLMGRLVGVCLVLLLAYTDNKVLLRKGNASLIVKQIGVT